MLGIVATGCGFSYYTLDVALGDDSGNASDGGASIDIFGMSARSLEPHPLEVPR